ncbi:hypothetical protein E2C01_019834 [Portunus trituberculatus]|uniref:Uncharacterized protein n=1 Tax=Portunus trituberculatus TaxID=210409 RepID=A0A5B7DYZ9_PORTR|nr:hypothetical protein [Portunus trituberculatus]
MKVRNLRLTRDQLKKPIHLFDTSHPAEATIHADDFPASQRYVKSEMDETSTMLHNHGNTTVVQPTLPNHANTTVQTTLPPHIL